MQRTLLLPTRVSAHLRGWIAGGYRLGGWVGRLVGRSGWVGWRSVAQVGRWRALHQAHLVEHRVHRVRHPLGGGVPAKFKFHPINRRRARRQQFSAFQSECETKPKPMPIKEQNKRKRDEKREARRQQGESRREKEKENNPSSTPHLRLSCAASVRVSRTVSWEKKASSCGKPAKCRGKVTILPQIWVGAFWGRAVCKRVMRWLGSTQEMKDRHQKTAKVRAEKSSIGAS